MKLSTIIQYLLPHHLLSRLIGKLANCRQPWIKKLLSSWFIKHYQIDMNEALEPDPHKYETFNQLFTRALQPSARPITQDPTAIISPIDGAISQIGQLNGEQLIQAKGFNFDLASLLSDHLDEFIPEFTAGSFATLYLSPQNYHRVHMPITGKLHSMVHIPGKLFSVNPAIVAQVPSLFARNERVITIFTTELGPVAVILVGAMLVASIETVWEGLIAPSTNKKITTWNYQQQNIALKRGQELGRFQFGSTVILLFPKNSISWKHNLKAQNLIRLGQQLGTKTNC